MQFPHRYTLWGCVMQTVSEPAYQHTSGAEGFTVHAPWMHHYLHCCRNLSQHCFINLVRCCASLHVPACIFSCCGNPTLLSRLSPKPIAPRWTTKSSRLCQRASTDLLSSYFQHFFIQAQRNDSAAVSAGRSALTCVKERVPACAKAPDPPASQLMCQLSAHVKTICRKSKSVSACYAGVKFHFMCS